MESIGPSVYAKVLSASSFGDESTTATLDVQDYGTISANGIDRIR
jgi:flagellar basal-body rod modification protein FlgD